jgi:dimethylglycine dehydrogenase
VVGELGYEVNCRAAEHATLRKVLLAAGEGLGLVEVGFNAMLSLRLEKSFGIWTYEFRQGYTPGMTGLDRFIDFSKPDFVGRAAALVEKQAGAKTVLVTLEVDATDADASGYEPVWLGGKRVGYVTSGGYGHTVRKSLALALLDRAAAAFGTELVVHVVGQERKARVIAPSPYDPEGRAMRAKV